MAARKGSSVAGKSRGGRQAHNLKAAGSTPAPASGGPFTLPHFKAWAAKLILDTGKPWVIEDFQAKFIEDLFLGLPENWFILPEGNTKTTTVAGLVVYHIEHRAEAWVPWAAASRDQAEIGYRQAKGFIVRSPVLRGRFRCYDGYRKIVYLGSGEGADEDDDLRPKLQIFAADQNTGDGVIPTLCVDDEPHRQRDMGLYRTWKGKLDKRKGQIVAISTAGEPGSEFEVARERIRQSTQVIESGPGFLRLRGSGIVMHEYAVPEDGDVEDFELVKAANPFSGITVQTLTAKRQSPTETLEHWRRFTCNLPTRGTNAAITEREWYAAITKEIIPEGEPVWLGADMAFKWDTTAIVPLWIRDLEFRLFGPAVVLTPPRDGGSLDPNDIKRAFRDLEARNPIIAVVMDTNKAEDIAAWLRDELRVEVVDRSQTNAFAAMDYEKFMEALRNGWLKHGGDADLTKHALNAVAKTLENKAVRFERPSQSRQGGDQTQERRVIDALAAASMVHMTAAAEIEAGSRWTAA